MQRCVMSDSKKNSLVFNCVVNSGMGMYSELEFPKHPLWPADMHAGSLNANILPNGFPRALDKMGEGWGVQKLDNKKFSALFNIAQSDIGNNMLTPRADNPERGTAQIWGCTVTTADKSTEFNAWAVRRIGSAYSDVIEIMSDKHLRNTYGLENGTEITVKLHEGQNNAQQEQQSKNWLQKFKNILG